MEATLVAAMAVQPTDRCDVATLDERLAAIAAGRDPGPLRTAPLFSKTGSSGFSNTGAAGPQTIPPTDDFLETPAFPSVSSTFPSGLNLNIWNPRPAEAGVSVNGPLSPAQKLPSWSRQNP